MKKLLYILIILILLPFGCISEFKAELPFEEDDILVVAGDIIENTEVDFVLSKSFSINSSKPPGESQNVVATVTLVGSDGYQGPAAAAMGKGVYRIAVGELKDDVAYGLRIEYCGNVYESELSTPLHTPEIDEVSWVQPEKFGDISFRVSTHDDTSSEPQYYMWNYQEDWEFPAWNYTRLYVHRLSPEKLIIDTLHYNYRYNCWKKNTVNELLVGSTELLTENHLVNHPLLSLDPEDERFRSLYCLTITQKVISRGAYEYYKSKKTENEEMGGIFTPQPSEVKSNVVCRTDPSKRTIGFVSVVKNITRKRVFVSEEDITRHWHPGCTLMSEGAVEAEQQKYGYKTPEDYLLSTGKEPVGDWFSDGKIVDMEIHGYADRSCVDCVLGGGTKDKPDFWPNDKI